MKISVEIIEEQIEASRRVGTVKPLLLLASCQLVDRDAVLRSPPTERLLI